MKFRDEINRQAIANVGERRWSTIGEPAKERARAEAEQKLMKGKPLGEKLKASLSLARLPTKWAVLLSLACGILTVFNQTTFDLPVAWKTSLTWGLALFAYLGIGPLLGPKFKAALHLPNGVAVGISVVLLVGMVVAQQSVELPFRAIIIGIIQIAGGLGFAPAYVPTI